MYQPTKLANSNGTKTKAKEGETGEKVENIPETPKEKPPMPHSEQQKLEGEKDVKKDKGKPDLYKTPDDVAGLEVRRSSALLIYYISTELTSLRRNRLTCRISCTTIPTRSPTRPTKTTSMCRVHLNQATKRHYRMTGVMRA